MNKSAFREARRLLDQVGWTMAEENTMVNLAVDKTNCLRKRIGEGQKELDSVDSVGIGRGKPGICFA